MLKKELYPKTTRMDVNRFQVTEKLDGANLGFFRLNGDLVIAQRNSVFLLSEIDQDKEFLYRGLYGWLKDNGADLLRSMHETSGIYGEWMGVGLIKYGQTFPKRFYIFAKANISGSFEDNTLEIGNLQWDRDLFLFPFVDRVIPEFMGMTPLVEMRETVSIKELDVLYDEYLLKVDRKVEGFVIHTQGQIVKYVRNKKNKLTAHQLPAK